jgi:sugar phosphate isomerase/epimerase
MKFLEIAQFLKSPIVRSVPAAFGKYIPPKELEKNLKKVLPEYEKEGIIIVLENQETYKAVELAELMDRINHPNLRICLNLTNGIGAMEGPEYVMGLLGPWCANLQFKDVKITRSHSHMEFSVEGTPAGKGQLPIHWALKKLKGYKTRHSTILELWPPWQGDIESTVRLEEKWVKESVEYMKTIFKD